MEKFTQWLGGKVPVSTCARCRWEFPLFNIPINRPFVTNSICLFLSHISTLSCSLRGLLSHRKRERLPSPVVAIGAGLLFSAEERYPALEQYTESEVSFQLTVPTLKTNRIALQNKVKLIPRSRIIEVCSSLVYWNYKISPQIFSQITNFRKKVV